MYVYFRLGKLLLRSLASRKQPVATVSKINLICTPADVDFNGHLNNGRFLTLMDLGRIHLILEVKGLFGMLRRRKWYPVVAEVTIAFRRPIMLFEKFSIETRITEREAEYFYLEQVFKKPDGTLAASARVKGIFLGPSGKIPTAEFADYL